MKMEIQKFLEENGLEKLVEEFKIDVKDYPDRVVLNYNQIDSPRLHPIVCECRALILQKNTWKILARSFNRFFNAGEDPHTSEFPFTGKVRFEEKVDGSIISFYFDEANHKWQAASRSCAFAEGSSTFGNTFESIFLRAIQNTNVLEGVQNKKEYTWIFELTSPETRVVTPYADYSVILTGARHLETGLELTGQELDQYAAIFNVRRPKYYSFKNLEEASRIASELPAMQEGFVLVSENWKVFWRMKCKNPKYLAIANLRANGQLSAFRILTLVMKNDQHEYLQYFPEDKPYFDYVEELYHPTISEVVKIWEQNKNQPTQKEYALAIIPLVTFDWQKGMLFSLRKGQDLTTLVRDLNPRKVALSMELKEKIQKKFSVKIVEDIP